MRLFCLTSIIIFWASLSFAFEVEQSHTWPGTEGGRELRIVSTADIEVFEPILTRFRAENPDIHVTYVITSSTELMTAIYDEGVAFDVAISSAMDLQTKLVNDGFAATHVSPSTRNLPDWAVWRDQLFAFTQEPAVMVVSRAGFAGLEIPRSREELVTVLRNNRDRFYGRIGTYDVARSGLGYLFATQDSRNSESFWRLTEVMGRLNTQLYCCSGSMIEDVASGELVLAYNVLGSYAAARLAGDDRVEIVTLNDFQSVMLRTAMILKGSPNANAAGALVDFLAGMGEMPDLEAATGLPSVTASVLQDSPVARPIRLGPGLLVFLDGLRRDAFLRSWTSSIQQQ